MTIYGILLEPSEILNEKIKNIKKEVEILVGNQLYLKDDPHLTLHHGDFKDILEWKDDFEQFIKKIKLEINKIQINIDNWITFENENNLQKITLACKLDEQSIDLLRKLQIQIVDYLEQFRHPIIIERYKKMALSNIQKQNLEKYGYPFVGNEWKPHLSIATFNKKDIDEIWTTIKNSCPIGNYFASSLNVYSLEGTEEILKLQKKYS